MSVTNQASYIYSEGIPTETFNLQLLLERQVSYFLGNFTPKTSNYCLKNRTLGVPGNIN